VPEFRNPPLTVDVIIEVEGKLLVIRRNSDTFNGYLAFPGGYVDYGETVENAVIREAKEELHIDVKPMEILGVYSDPDRDPRGHVVSIVFVCEYKGEPKAGDDASSYEWIPLDTINQEKLAFDHGKIIEDYKQWKTKRLTFWSTK
jgi:mutator protein MutT